MTEKEKIRFIEYLKLHDELKSAAEGGALFVLGECFSNPERLASVCVFNESDCYTLSTFSGNEKGSEIIALASEERRAFSQRENR